MKPKYFLPFLFLFLISCSSDEGDVKVYQPIPFQIDEATIVNRTTPCAEGYLNGQIISWQFGFNTFQSWGSSTPTPEDPVGMLSYGLNAENNVDNHFKISTPVYDTSNPTAFESIFSLGEKQLGNIVDNFYIQFEKDNKFYESRNGVSGKIKILKTQEYIESGTNTPHIRVWFRVMNSKIMSSGQTVRFDGVIIAQFYSYKHF